MRKWLRAVDGNDVMAGLGMVFLFYGLYLFSPGLAFAVVGGLMVAAGVIGTLRRGSR